MVRSQGDSEGTMEKPSGGRSGSFATGRFNFFLSPARTQSTRDSVCETMLLSDRSPFRLLLHGNGQYSTEENDEIPRSTCVLQ